MDFIISDLLEKERDGLKVEIFRKHTTYQFAGISFEDIIKLAPKLCRFEALLTYDVNINALYLFHDVELYKKDLKQKGVYDLETLYAVKRAVQQTWTK